MNVLWIMEAVAKASPAQLAAFNAAYDEYAAYLRRLYPNERAIAKVRAARLLREVAVTSRHPKDC